MGVTVRTNKKGKKGFIAQIFRGGRYKALGSHKTEELAAAAVQEYLGKEEEAARLRKLAEQKTDREIRKLKEETKVTVWDCSACGAGYKYKPDQCGKCGGSSFTPARPESKD
jgi:rubrerythrin